MKSTELKFGEETLEIVESAYLQQGVLWKEEGKKRERGQIVRVEGRQSRRGSQCKKECSFFFLLGLVDKTNRR